MGVQVWGCSGARSQQFIWCSDGRIVSALNDQLCLDVPGGDPSKVSSLQMWPCNTKAGQYWKYDSNNLAVYPSKTGETMCMDVNGGATKPGTSVIVYDCKPGTGEKWNTGDGPSPVPVPKCVGK